MSLGKSWAVTFWDIPRGGGWAPVPYEDVARFLRVDEVDLCQAVKDWERDGGTKFFYPTDPPEDILIHEMGPQPLVWVQKARTWGNHHRMRSPARRLTLELLV